MKIGDDTYECLKEIYAEIEKIHVQQTLILKLLNKVIEEKEWLKKSPM